MPLTLTELEASRDRLVRALATGERSVTFADRSVTYRTIDEIIQALRAIEGQIAAASGRPKQWAATATKGLDA